MSDPDATQPRPGRPDATPRPSSRTDGGEPGATSANTGPAARASHRAVPARPDPRPMRTLIGLTGLVATSAIASAIASQPGGTIAATATTIQTQVVLPAEVRHITRYVQLQPGQTAPPSAVVRAAPDPTPRIVVVTTTRQSGKP